MSFARLHKVVTYLIAGLGLFALTFGGELGPLAIVLVAGGYLASILAEEPRIARPGWIRGWTVAVAVLLGLQVARWLVLDEGLLTLAIEFAAFLQVSRLFNRRTARDHQQIAILAFLHLIAATVLSTDLGYAATFLGFVIVTPWMLALSHLRREIEGNYPGSAQADVRAVADVRRVLASRRVVGAGFLAGTALLAVPLFVMMTTVFLLFPRVGMGFLSFGRSAGQRVAGFGSNVELGGFGVIRDDPTVVLRVTPPDLPADPPAYASLWLRGTSFDHWDGRRWSRTPARGESVGRTFNQYAIERWQEDGDKRYQIVLDHLDEPVIFIPQGTVALEIPPRVRNGVEQGRRVFRAQGHDFRYGDDDELGLVYAAWVDPSLVTIGGPSLEPEERIRYLALPALNPRVAALARRIAGDATRDRVKADRILAFLRDGNDFRYSLEQPRVGADEDPVEVFLIRAKRGHCEYFSTAMAVMLRSLGIPARNVTGFAGGRWNPYGSYYAIRQGDAHSWVEVFIEGQGWISYDPTPPSRDAIGPDEGVLSGLDALVDAIRTRWSTDVVGYDLRAQVGMVASIAELVGRLRGTSSGVEEAERARDREPGGALGRAAWVAIVAAIVGAIVVFAWRRRRRRPRDVRRAVLSASARDAVGLYRDLERALARRGRPRHPSVTPTEHAARLADERFQGADEVAEVTRRYVEARYGGLALPPAELQRLRKLVQRVSG